MRVYVDSKGNGFIVSALNNDSDTIRVVKEVVVEGKDPKKIGNAVLSMYQKPRKSRAKKEVAA